MLTVFIFVVALLHSASSLLASESFHSSPKLIFDCNRIGAFDANFHHGRTAMEKVATNEGPLQQGPIGLYVHIPYCRRRCRYCNFAIVPIGEKALTENLSRSPDEPLDRATKGFVAMDKMYVQAMLNELQLIATSSGKPATSIPLGSVYFGGGTPSLAPTDTIEDIMNRILDKKESPFYLQDDAEITIEMDPGTFSLEKLQFFKRMGFNRISLGVQSFDNDILASIGRVHRRQDIFNSLTMIQQVFGDAANYSLDLISGLPGLTLAKWAETLEYATNLKPTPKHLSIYDLQIEQGTVFDKWYKKVGDENTNVGIHLQNKVTLASSGTVPPFLPSPDDCAFMYKYASGYLKSKGYEHYEISSYAFLAGQSSQSPFRSRHNQIYWTPKGQWYAIGLGSTSLISGKSVARPRTLLDYIRWVEHQQAMKIPEWLLLEHDECDSVEAQYERFTDMVMTRLRTSDGLNLDWIQQSYTEGNLLVQTILRGASLGLELGLVQRHCSSSGADTLRLVDPTGFLYSNTIISSIFFELEGSRVRTWT